MNNDSIGPVPSPSPLPGNPGRFRIRVLGVGGAGCNAVSHLAASGLSGVTFAALNTDATALDGTAVATRLSLGAKSMRGLGAGGDPVRGRAAAEEDAAEIRQLCEGADVVFVVAGLGGGTGTGGSPVVARIARECGALVLSIVILPFDCEGGRRQRQAQLGLHELKDAADGVVCISNQRVFKLIDEKTSLLEAFRITNEFIAQGVRGIWRLLARPGLINVDFADLCTVTRERHAESALVTAEARGENRAREVIERLMAHPLVDGGQWLADAGGVVVCIAGSSDLSLSEVNRVMEHVSRQCEQAHIIMGAAIDDELGDRISVTLLAAKGTPGSEPPPCLSIPAMGGVPTSGEVHNLMPSGAPPRPASRIVAPAPAYSAEKTEQLLSQQSGGRARRIGPKMRQVQLPLEIVSKGRFEKSEPTIHQGQDLDMPTYIRRGVALN